MRFFSPKAPSGPALRALPLGTYITLTDNDSYAFTPTMLDTLRRNDAEEQHYISAMPSLQPRIEGSVPE